MSSSTRPVDTASPTPTPSESSDGPSDEPARATMRAGGRISPLRRMGADAESILAAVTSSPNFHEGRFHSPEPTHRPDGSQTVHIAAAAWRQRGRGRPAGEVPIVAAQPATVPGPLAVTWYGHATTVVEIDGARFLLDPVFSDRASPVGLTGPHRLHPAPGQIEDLPSIDAVLISHDHYDHLDEPSIAVLEAVHRPRYVVPLGVDAHLLAWGVPRERIIALDWFDDVEVSGIRLTCTPARHNSGRGFTEAQTLWAGWAMRGPAHGAYFAGDSGPSGCFTEIGARLGPFDLTIIPVGAYDQFWPDIHVNPAEALDAHVAVNTPTDAAAGVSGGDGQPVDHASRSVMLPVHWATFNLALHWWSEPVRWLRRLAGPAGIPVVYPRVGARVDLTTGTPTKIADRHGTPWWQECAADGDHD
ncbi:MAG: MBL fold metallo-hydrolase [Humibacillus sp.]|nr:MBL fold metallo-hydrolase [Humibacillus sp.]MDN5777860.1 MBL fold metallo-hydrolase [Humibacillus sp.]